MEIILAYRKQRSTIAHADSCIVEIMKSYKPFGNPNVGGHTSTVPRVPGRDSAPRCPASRPAMHRKAGRESSWRTVRPLNAGGDAAARHPSLGGSAKVRRRPEAGGAH